MVIAYHVNFACYGFWLPNDPRGSNSDQVRAEHLKKFGPAKKVRDSRSHALDPHDRALRAAAKRALVQPPVELSGLQAKVIGDAFGAFARKSKLQILACAILPCHVHLVIARHTYGIEQVVNLLKGAATTALIKAGLHPGQVNGEMRNSHYRVWGRNQRKVFCFEIAEVRDKVDYVERNPVKEGKPRQRWSFVVPVDAVFGSDV